MITKYLKKKTKKKTAQKQTPYLQFVTPDGSSYSTPCSKHVVTRERMELLNK